MVLCTPIGTCRRFNRREIAAITMHVVEILALAESVLIFVLEE